MKTLMIISFCLATFSGGLLFFDGTSVNAISDHQASHLYGGQSLGGGLFDTITDDEYCVEIDDCDDDYCQGGLFSCWSHVERMQTHLTDTYLTSQCESRVDSDNCTCYSTMLNYTCSVVLEGCYYDEDEERCRPQAGTGFQMAPQFCLSACAPVILS